MQDRLGSMVGKIHYLSDKIHYRYDNSLAPGLTIDSGDTVTLVCKEAADGQFTKDSTVGILDHVDWERIHALSGPIAINDAEPGDTLKVEVLEFGHHGWGWTALFPGFGLLADEFGDQKHLRIWNVSKDGLAQFIPNVRVPIEPFLGEMGVAWETPGPQPTMPPTILGGNMDCRHTGKGATVYFPVKVPGALFSAGDGHLAQGDGEVAGTAIEAPLDVTLRFTLMKNQTIPAVRFETSGPTTHRADGMGHYVTCGTGPDIQQCSIDAVSLMVEKLNKDFQISREDAYVICSAAGDLKIAVPVLGEGHAAHVTFHMPKSIFIEEQ